ncbi:MAG TPA: TonB-dependent receptor [Rhizomicrobium sp.]|nr:TonB-dependent receptor [Rhizomicrobium sp.]HWA12905.1 TonB-dependent receptor [Burkholderiales bacterium]
MPAKRSLGTIQSLTFVNALLVTTAFTAPAFAQIETVVVTAEKKAEDIQSTPIAVTAYSAQDLAAHQVNGFKDIQFSTPNVTYTKANFTGTNFQIRGIGTQVISGDAESGIAFNIDDVYYANAPVDSGQFYDIERVEVLRGPQSTLYGRGATGGAVNVFSNKPQLDAFSASIDASYGTYDTTEVKGMVNMPIVTDELGVRVAADWVRHDGYATNIDPVAGDRHPDSRDQWSARGLIRWQPTQDTTIDVIYSHANENDTRMRGEKQLCHTDPTGVLGCLPDSLASEPVNPNATFFNIPVSVQATSEVFNPVLGGAAGLLGLFDLTQPYVAPPGAVPSDPRSINSDFTPTLKQHSNSLTGEVKQRWSDWLDMTLVGGYADGKVVSQESYTNSPGAPFARGATPPSLDVSLATFQAVLDNYVGLGLVPASYADPVNGPYAFILNPTFAGTLPTSNFTNNGIIGGSINRYTANPFAYDQSNGSSKQESADLRFNTNFTGPLNFMLAAYYLNVIQWGDYYVGANTLDYGQTLLGAIFGPVASGIPECSTQGCIFGTSYYDNRTQRSTIESKAIYGEAYWDAIPDTLKFTLGLRGTEDIKDFQGRITIFNGFEPIGSTSNDGALLQCFNEGQSGCDFDAGKAGAQLWEETHRTFDKLTGRFVVNYNPHWDLTDATFLYASYARGYKAGGSNPGAQTQNLGVPGTYEPETIDAYEIGAKNTLLDGRMQANLTAWYYNYGGYQISSIIANTSVNTNIQAFLGGFEGEFIWAPTDRWQFNLNTDWTQSQIGQSLQIDTRNPGGNDPNALVIKDGTLSTTNAQNCVIYYTGPQGGFDAAFAQLNAASGGVFFAPPGGTSALAQYGIAHASFGVCTKSVLDALTSSGLPFAESDPAYPGSTTTGVPVDLHGNQLANTPPYSVSFGAQYTTPVGGGFNLVSRIDYFWQAAMWGRIFNGPADRINSYGVMNALFTLNAPDNAWYVQAYARNLLGGSHVTGEYLTSSSSGLWTGMFYGEPRTVGIQVGAKF